MTSTHELPAAYRFDRIIHRWNFAISPFHAIHKFLEFVTIDARFPQIVLHQRSRVRDTFSTSTNAGNIRNEAQFRTILHADFLKHVVRVQVLAVKQYLALIWSKYS